MAQVLMTGPSNFNQNIQIKPSISGYTYHQSVIKISSLAFSKASATASKYDEPSTNLKYARDNKN